MTWTHVKCRDHQPHQLRDVELSRLRLRRAAKGVSVAGLVGKTKKHKSVSSGYALAPRVTQVQQTFSVDIILVKKIAF